MCNVCTLFWGLTRDYKPIQSLSLFILLVSQFTLTDIRARQQPRPQPQHRHTQHRTAEKLGHACGMWLIGPAAHYHYHLITITPLYSCARDDGGRLRIGVGQGDKCTTYLFLSCK